MILDLSFQLRSAQHPHKSVNDATTPRAPAEAMQELGNVLKRILARLSDGHASNPQKPFMFSKLDIKDGFWRMIVSEDDAWNFCYAIPPPTQDTPLDDIQIVVPNSLQMGWCESPPFFCAATETGRDVIESLIDTTLPPHKFEEKMIPTNFDSLPQHCANLLSTTTLIEVYVDDYIACIDNITKNHIRKVSRAMLHGIHTIFPPPAITGHNGGDPISEKKLEKLEGQWAHVKEILGWIVDGVNFTIRLPIAKIDKIKKTLRRLKKSRSIKVKDFQKITGTLNHAAYGMPGGRGLFTVLWKALAKSVNGYVQITAEVRQAFRDFQWLFGEMANNPVHVAQLVHRDPHCNGYSDACKWGAGGVWILPQTNGTCFYIFWTIKFPPDVVKRFETGILSVNDLELAGIVLHWLVLEHLLPSLQFVSAGIQCDNSSSVAWTKKFTAHSIIAGYLLRALALRQQICKAAPLLVAPIAGNLNLMADVASRYHSDKSLQMKQPSLLAYFNTYFKQQTSWTEFHLKPKLVSRVMSSLRGDPLSLESWRRLPGLVKNIGKNGVTMQTPSTSTLFSNTPILSSATSPSQPSLLGRGRVTTASAIKSRYKPLIMQSRPSTRPSNWLGSRAPSTVPTTSTISKLSDASKACAAKIPPPSPN